MTKLRALLRIGVTFAFLGVGALWMLVVAIPTLGLARRFYSEVIGRWIGVGVLRMSGIRYRVHGALASPSIANGVISGVDYFFGFRRMLSKQEPAQADRA